MRRFAVSKQFDNSVPITERVSTVLRMFGVSIDRLNTNRNIHKCDVEVNDGDIVYITGPSGAGKSVLLREIQNKIPADERISIDTIALPDDKAAIDSVGIPDAPGGTIQALQMLGYAGLSDAFCVLTAPANLSEGQKYRFRLACCLATGKKFIFADEFCSNLDRITAAVIAYNVRRFAERARRAESPQGAKRNAESSKRAESPKGGVTFFLASSHEDILADLQPDVLIVKHFTGPAEVSYRERRS
jgi:ABC-type ATPase with predicted acetyltransferase domain